VADRVALADEHRELLVAYARTRLEFRDPATGRDLVLHPEPRGSFGVWPFPGASTAAVVTAWHPRSDPGRDPGRNRRDLERLRGAVVRAGFRAIDCVGIGAATDAPDAASATATAGEPAEAWSEPSLLVPGADREIARGWASRYEQNAIFWWTPSEWTIVGVLLVVPDVILGWRVSLRD
jgi:hypothetical protein